MQTTLNPSEISDLIKKRVEELNISAETRNEGTVVSVSDGISRLHGLEDAKPLHDGELPHPAGGTPRRVESPDRPLGRLGLSACGANHK